MMHETVFAIGIAAYALSALVYRYSVSRRIHEYVRETSRFPMFAVRCQLVALVAEERVSENNEAWGRAYRTTNQLLHKDRRLNALECFWRYIEFRVELERNPELRAELDRTVKESEALEKLVPEFVAVQERQSQAFAVLMRSHTRLWHRGTIKLLALVAIAVQFVLSRQWVRNFVSGVSSVAGRTEPKRHSGVYIHRRSSTTPATPNTQSWKVVFSRVPDEVSSAWPHPGANELPLFEDCAHV